MLNFFLLAPQEKKRGMGQKESSEFGPMGFDPSIYKKVVLVRGVSGSGRRWLCEQLRDRLRDLPRDNGCECHDLNQLIRDNFNPQLSGKENTKKLEQKFKEMPSKTVILISDKLIQSRTAVAKFFIELDMWSLEKAFRRRHIMNINRIQSHANKLKDAIRTGPLTDIDKAFDRAGFDHQPTMHFTDYVLAYHRDKTQSEKNGYTVLPCQAIRHEIEKICG